MKQHSAAKQLFGSTAEIIVIEEDKYLADAAINEAYAEAIRLHRIFNFYDKESELSQLNINRKRKMSKEFINVLKDATEISKLTGGKYDVSLGKKFLQRKKGEEESELKCSYKDIEVNANEVTLLNEDVLIDLGSIAKGYITDRMAEKLKEEGILAGMINARGDLVNFGSDSIIDVQNPREEDKIVCTIAITDGAIATSGDYRQYKGNYDKSHIINKSKFISATVHAKNLERADLFATALMTLNQEEAKELLEKNADVAALLIDSEMKLYYYNGFDEMIKK